MKLQLLHIALYIALGLGLASCSDDLAPQSGRLNPTDTDDLGFSPDVVEQASLLVRLGQTRANNGMARFDSITTATLTAIARPLHGASTTTLYLHRHPLPVMGIHPSITGSQPTRALVSDIIPSGTHPINFHDSLTLWGCVYNTNGTAANFADDHYRFLLKQTLLKKIRGFRTSVHWPYENTVEEVSGTEQDCAPWQGEFMRFFAIAPAFESIEHLSVTNAVYNNNSGLIPPTLTYTVPDEPSAQRDLLFGMSPVIDVQAGPTGLGKEATYPYANTEREQHLGTDDKEIPLTFCHILTAVRFAQGKMPAGVTITKLELHDIVSQGTFTPNTATLPGTWSSQSGLQDYNIITAWTPAYYDASDYAANTENKSLPKTYAEGENVYIDNGQVLLLMPHTLGSTATLSVSLTDAHGVHTLTCSLTGDIWAPGYTVTYAITVGEVANDYYLYVDGHAVTKTGDSASDAREETTAVSGSFSIHSYRNFLDYVNSENGSDVNYAADWQVTGFSSTQDGTYTTTKPTWLTAINGWSEENAPKPATGGTPATLSYSIAQQSSVNGTLNHATILQQNMGVTNFDLSTTIPDGTKNSGHTSYAQTESANSYIINAPGSYSIPVVYGNSMGKDLSSNTVFKDHNGHYITTHSIKEQTSYISTEHAGYDAVTNGLTSDEINAHTYTSTIISEKYRYDITATIIWKDTPNEITSGINYNSSSGTITFTVPQGNMTPCNFIIGVYGRKGMVSQEVQIKENGTNKETRTYQIPSPTYGEYELLWAYHIWMTDEVYPNNGNFDQYFSSYNITNNSKIPALQDKDGTVHNIMPVPLGWVPTNLTWNVYKPREVWVEVQQVEQNRDNSHNTIHLKIRQEARPECITGSSTIYQWGSPTAHPMDAPASGSDIAWGWWGGSAANANYWSTGSKTLYDPCPPGFQMPSGSIFTGFSLTGANIVGTNSGAELNIWQNAGSETSAILNKGAYIYTKRHNGTIPADDRYGDMVYIPASGIWSAPGSSYRSFASTVFSWTGGSANGNGLNIRLRPQKGSSSSTNDYFLYDEQHSFSSAMPIIPVMQ